MATQLAKIATDTADTSADIAVVGGGMTGGALALGLAQQGFQVAVIEHTPPPVFDASKPPEVRVSAISLASVRLLEQLGVWQQVMAMRCHPYQRLETWEWDSAIVQFDAGQLHLPCLGYMVENSVLQRAIWQQMQRQPQIRLYALAQLLDIRQDGDQRSSQQFHQQQFQQQSPQQSQQQQIQQITLSDGQLIRAPLIIGADGANSQTRQQAGIGICGWQYRQHCLLITVQCEQAAGNTTWQQFTADGPQALLPLFDQWATLAWYQQPARVRQLQAMSATQLQQQIQAEFPARLGHITPIAWSAFPLTRRHALGYIRSGFVLAGDAAHTIHPLAGQGVNLGYRDVRTLIEVLTQARQRQENWAELAVLKRYQRRRMPDNQLMQSAMDLFYAGFSNHHPPLRLLRNLGLMAAQRSGILKRQALKYALGI